MTAIAEYRPQALAVEDFQKLDALAMKSLSFRERQIAQVYREQDEYGDMVEKRRYVDGGPEIFSKGEVSPRLVESLQRPASARHVGTHLLRLAAHKPWGRGKEGWSIITEDLCRDLEGVSEYAIMKTCEKFRRDDALKFFPDTAVFLKYCRDLDFSLKQLAAIADEKPQQIEQQKPAPLPPRTAKSRRRVNRLCKLAVKPKANWTKWEMRFYDAHSKAP